LFIYLTPLLPLSFEGEGDGMVLKGQSPFKLPLMSDLLLRGQNTKGEFKRGVSPS
jgi:hypothetical protein